MKYLLCFLLCTPALFAQRHISGSVKEAVTHRTIPYATITVEGKKILADEDGNFSFDIEKSSDFNVSFWRFESVQVKVTDATSDFTVFLKRVPKSLRGKIPNPATAIIAEAIRRRNENDPEKKLNSFQFKAYNRIVLTANPDSVRGDIDSINVSKIPGIRKVRLDSTQYKFKKAIEKQHLFLSEKVSRYEYDGQRLKETVIGTKMAGFQQPVYEIIGFNLQSFSTYDDNYELFGSKYNNPIAPDATNDYEYTLIDTTEVAGRNAYMIFFRNKKYSRSSGLEGVLYLDCETFGIAKAFMRIRGVLNISGTHEFTFLEPQKIWFPSKRSFRIVKGNSDVDIRILGETIRFDAITDTKSDSRKKEASDYSYILSETSYSDFKYDVPMKITHPYIAIEVGDQALHQPESFWNRYRKDSLDRREKQTYRALDSIVEHQKIEKKLRLGRKIINGYIPFGPVDLDLRYLLSYNNYEGFRVGLGGITSEKFSQKFRIDAYTAYGTKDGGFKYNLGTAVRIGRFTSTWIGASYTDDVREIASTSFAIDKRVFKLYDPRPINVSTFYNHVTSRAYVETRFIPKTESIWQLSQSWVEPKFNYFFRHNGTDYSIFRMTTALVSVQWNPFSDFMQTPTGRIEMEKRFPKFTFQFTKSIPGLFKNDFDFGKIDFRAEYEKKFLNGQRSSVLVEAGYAFGDTPLTHLYNTSPNNLTKDHLLQRITIAGKNSFETMYFNEFFSSQYIKLQLKHGLKKMLISHKVKPVLVLVSRMAWGDMKHPEQHIGIDYKTLEKGFFESGIELNQIYKGFGLSGFYRYGPYQLPKFEDNLSVKISFILNFGL